MTPIILNPPPPVVPGAPGTVTPDPLPTAADDLYRRMGPLLEADPVNGYALMAYVHGIAEQLQPIADVTGETDTHLPWEGILDPVTAPLAWLQWLAQIPGVDIPPSDTEAQARDRIAQAAGIYEGTENALKLEVARTLTSGDPAMVRVVYPAFWGITVRTRTSDTPDPAAAQAAALAQTPAGYLLTYIVSNEPIIDEGTRAIDAAVVTIDAPPTLADVT
jgi:hypothetical protein